MKHSAFGAPIRRDGCRRRSILPTATAFAATAPLVFSTGTNLVVGLDERLILKIFPPMLRAQFVSERGSLSQLARPAPLPIPEIVARG